tara:strand:- start:186 stop:593 length:408 start_codon:yes stop_codon:yes gene_type:complete
MTYQAHDPLGMDEDDKSYHRGGEDNPLDYHTKEGSDDVYSSKPGDLYDSGEQNEDLKNQDDDSETIEESLGFSEDDPKYEKKDEADDSVVANAANEVFQEGQQVESKQEKKNAKKSIEDAINKAIKDEKEVLHLD